MSERKPENYAVVGRLHGLEREAKACRKDAVFTIRRLLKKVAELEIGRENVIQDSIDQSDRLTSRINKLEKKGFEDRATCRWCGTIHARKMNTLCPLTIAEAAIERVKACDEHTFDSRDPESYMRTADVLKALDRSKSKK